MWSLLKVELSINFDFYSFLKLELLLLWQPHLVGQDEKKPVKEE
jgi:hypothetical protein